MTVGLEEKKINKKKENAEWKNYLSFLDWLSERKFLYLGQS